VTTARCPACGASVLDGAPWCTLCYADLRAPAPAAAPEPAVQQPAQPTASAAPAMLPVSGAVDLLDPAPALPAAVPNGAALGPATWPCSACSAAVGLEHDSCPQCLTPFLAGADPAATVDLPLLGSIRPLTATKTSRAWVMVGGTIVVSIVLTIVISLLGLLF
jgi:hypothetical protein